MRAHKTTCFQKSMSTKVSSAVALPKPNMLARDIFIHERILKLQHS